MAEQLKNSLDDPTSSLAGAVDAVTDPVTFSVAAGQGSRFPAVGNFRILIGSELLLCTSRTADAITATRAAEGTTIAAHLAGTAVNLVLTAGGFADYAAAKDAANTFTEDQSIAPAHRLSFQNTATTPDNSTAPWQLQISGGGYDKVFRLQYNLNADGTHIDPTMHGVRMAWESRWTGGDPAALQGATEWYLELDRDKTGSTPTWRRPFSVVYDMDNEAVSFNIGSAEDTWWKTGAASILHTRAVIGSDDGSSGNNVLTVGSDVPDGSIGAMTLLNLSAHYPAAMSGDFIHAYHNGVLKFSVNANGDITQSDTTGINAGVALTFLYSGYAQIMAQPGARLIIGLDADTSYIEFQRRLFIANKDIQLGTTTGTKIGTVGGAAGQKLGFWNATPVVQPVLATGAGRTVDDVITYLQTLGLARQS